ncbi:MAG: peptide chain release factor 1 [Pseudomonadota bacterium]
MFNKLDEVVEKFEALTDSLMRPEIASDPPVFAKIAKERSDLEPVVEAYRKYKDVAGQIGDNELLQEDKDPDIREMASEELGGLRERRQKLEDALRVLLLPRDPRDDKNIILEIRAGTGGEEAALFAADLFRMYSRYAEKVRWKVELLSSHETGLGGFKEIQILIAGHQVYSHLKYEAGVHRVQRVPETEAQGRIHTSAVTVAVLPEAEEVDVEIDEDDLRIDVYRSSGAGGQHVNTTDSAVRITHIPTGVVVACQDERSQHKNKAKGMKILRSRILEARIEEQQQSMASDRRSQVGSGDRSERIRTYNFPQNRLTDHRVGLTLYKLEQIMEGELNYVLDPVHTYFQAEALRGTKEEG